MCTLQTQTQTPRAQSITAYSLQSNRNNITLEPGKHGDLACIHGLRGSVHDVLSIWCSEKMREKIVQDCPEIVEDSLPVRTFVCFCVRSRLTVHSRLIHWRFDETLAWPESLEVAGSMSIARLFGQRPCRLVGA